MTLLDLSIGETATIIKIRGRGAYRRRLMEMGISTGEKIKVIRKAPLNDPIEYELKGFKILLRKIEAELIDIDNGPQSQSQVQDVNTMVLGNENNHENKSGKNISVCLIGNCTSGKTTILNQFTGLNEKVGNYAGVTQQASIHEFSYKDYTISITDLPGVYSLAGEQPANLLVRDFLKNNPQDIIINVVDATNLERNLYLTTDLIDYDQKVIMALNMFDDFQKSNQNIDHKSLGVITGVPVVPLTALKGKGIAELKDKILEVYLDKDRDLRHIHIHYGDQLEKAIHGIQQLIKIKENEPLLQQVSSRFLAIKLLQNDSYSYGRLNECWNSEEINNTVKKEQEQIQKRYSKSSEQLIADYKFGFIKGALKETSAMVNLPHHKTDVLDKILTHKYFGLPIFFMFMWLMFYATFKLGSFPMQWIETLVNYLSDLTASHMADGMLKDLIIDGIFSGVGGVLVFLPNILILYFFISLMEDTGYMSRAVFIMDKIMHLIGLHGKSFIPLIMGFGCNVPAILSSRMLENKKERLITIFINPFMSCNARLPVYILFISAFFPDSSGTMLFIVYFTGIAIAIITALILSRIFKSDQERPFVMELPPYRVPSGNVMMKNMWEKSSQYLKKIGSVILIASVIFWALSYFPLNTELSRDYDKELTSVNLNYQKLISSAGTDTSVVSAFKLAQKKETTQILLAKKSEKKEKSYLGKFGHFIEPVIRPLGFDWRIGISIISGIPAKEIIVSSLAVLYQVDESDANSSHTLVDRLKNAKYQSGPNIGKNVFNPAVALAFMIFVLLYIPCIGTISAIKQETGSWKWGLFSVVYSFTLAWSFAFIANHIIGLFI